MTPEWLIYAAVVLAGLAGAVAIIGQRRAANVRHLAALFLAVMVVTYLVRPLVVVALDSEFDFIDRNFYAYREFGGSSLALMGLLVVASLLSFALGYRRARRPTIGSSSAPATGASPVAVARSIQAGAALLVIGYASFAISQRGFIGVWGNNLEYVVHDNQGSYANSSGFAEMTNYLVITGTLLLFAATHRWWLAALVSAPWFYNQMFFGWSRHKTLALVLGLLAVEVLRGGRLFSSRARVGASFAGAFVVLLLLIAMRQNRFFMSEGGTVRSAADATFSMPIDRATADADGFEPSWVTMHQVGSLDKTYGLDIFYYNLIVLVPRQIWPSKPRPTDFTWSKVFGLGDMDAPPRWPLGAVRGAIGDALQQWGWVGPFVNFYLTGILFALAERRYARARGTPAAVATYAAAFSLLPLLGRDTIWHILPDYLYLFAVPYLVAGWWAGQRGGARDRSDRRTPRTIPSEEGGGRQAIAGPFGHV